MLFVDGSNLLIELATVLGVQISAENPRDEALSLACQVLTKSLRNFEPEPLGPHRTVRRYWFGAFCGSDAQIDSKRKLLRDAGFEAVILPKTKGSQEKGVDLAVARHMLVHGFNKNYSVAVLVSGDADYLGLVDDVKRMGHVAAGMFYEGKALAPSLRLAFDAFYTLPHPISVNQALTECLTGVA